MKTVELTTIEQQIIKNALQMYWSSACANLIHREKMGESERTMFVKRFELTKPLIEKFENL